MRRSALLRIAVAAVLCAATVTPAGIRDRGFEAGFYGGQETGDVDTNIKSHLAYGVKFAYAVNRKLMAELNVDSFNTSFDYIGRAGDPSFPVNQVPFSRSVDTDFMSYTLGMTANFLTDREVKTTPYLSVGIGVMTEVRSGTQFCVDIFPQDSTKCSDVKPDGGLVDPNSNKDPNGVDWITEIRRRDTGAAVTIAVGGRTFLTNWFAIRYEGRWYHHDTFGNNQDAFQATVGATFTFGGKK